MLRPRVNKSNKLSANTPFHNSFSIAKVDYTLDSNRSSTKEVRGFPFLYSSLSLASIEQINSTKERASNGEEKKKKREFKQIHNMIIER